MLVRLCNRCMAPVPPMPSASAVTIPADDPATRPKQVTGDVTIGIAIAVVTEGADLCPVCLVSAFVEYALVVMRDALTAKIATQLQRRIDTALGFAVTVAADAVAAPDPAPAPVTTDPTTGGLV